MPTPCNLFLSEPNKGSIEMANSDPESGHLCLMPQVTAKGLVKEPLVLSIL